MKKTLRHWIVAAVGAAAALAFSSCAYDPYYSGGGGSYSTGYGDGYGYGGSNFSTSYFVATGDPRWGYDPYNYSYYDYQRRSYYDPYLDGYYPIGYRPPIIIGAPHPHGWRPGHGHIRPPSHVHHRIISNYRNREASYRNTNYGWSRNVHQQAISRDRKGSSDRFQRSGSQPRPSNNFNRESQPGSRLSPSRSSDRGRNFSSPSPRGSSQSSTYNRTIRGPNIGPNSSSRQYSERSAPTRLQPQPRQMTQPATRRMVQPARSSGRQQQIQRAPGNSGGSSRSRQATPPKENQGRRGMRSLGQG